MIVDVVVPVFEEASAEAESECRKCRLVFWFKDEGERVTKGEELVEVSTDKAVIDVESPATGILKSVRVGADEEVTAGAKIGEIEAA